jgi:hypothetical protein
MSMVVAEPMNITRENCFDPRVHRKLNWEKCGLLASKAKAATTRSLDYKDITSLHIYLIIAL